MKFIAILLVLLSAHAMAAASEPGVYCSEGLQSDVPLLNTALHNIYSFSYIREAIDQLRRSYSDVQLCVSALAVSRNIYQYPEYLIRVDVHSADRIVHRMTFLFQDASVQALDNVGDKPWIGLPPQATDTLSQYVLAQKPQTIATVAGAFDVEAIAKNSFTYKNCTGGVDAGTFSILPVDVAVGGKHFYIVSWLTLQGSNPFSSFVYLKAILIAHDTNTGEVAVAENLWLMQDLLSPLSSEVEDVPDDQRVARLLEEGTRR